MMISKHFDMAINAALLVWAVTLAFTLWAGWLDWRTRKIPNWLTVAGFTLGIGIRSEILGWHGALSSLEGAGLALAMLLPVVLLRGLGAGDWKLMGSVGALLGPWGMMVVLFVSVMVSGVMAILTIMQTGRVFTTLRNVAVLVKGFFVFGWRGNPKFTIDNPGLLKLPFGVAAALATLICFIASRWSQ
jgi:prepilin peptidase CpaA